MLFLKIYVVFSLFVFVLFELKMHSLEHMIKTEYKFKPTEDVDLCGVLFVSIKILLMCFIPIMNAAILFLLLFKSEFIDTTYKNKMETIINNKGEL